MSDKKGKGINLSGLSKGGQSNSFLSFRFSPESEEIQQIVQDTPGDNQAGQSESAPPSPKPTSGDVSPLKEYLTKEKHKWINKWDKKSLSLDLDLKGKIRTAIEDKRKSILSNFIPEESSSSSSNLPQSQSIPENIGSSSRVFSSEQSSEENSLSSNASSSAGKLRQNFKARHNSSGNTSQVTLEGDDSSSAGSPEHKATGGGGSSSLGDNTGDTNDVEEIGLEMTESHCGRLLEESLIVQLCEFYVPGEHLVEHYGGLPTLYQPTSLITGLRIIPIERSSDTDFHDELSVSASPSTNLTDVLSHTSVVPPTEAGTGEAHPSHIKEDLRLSVFISEVLRDGFENRLAKYWFALIAANLILPFPGVLAAIGWFIAGVLITGILAWTLVTPKVESVAVKTEVNSSSAPNRGTIPSGNSVLVKEFKLPTKSQGWMTQMEGEYDVDNCTFRQTKLVFVRLDGYNLYLSYPHPRTRIPKRRLYNDPPISPCADVLFMYHKVYTISGAQISIVPEGLAQRRVWNKKYPIAITLSKHSILTRIDPSPSADALLGVPLDVLGGCTAPDNTSVTPASVNYNANSADVSVNTQAESARVPIKKEVTKEDCGSQTIYLFARCDREKDDWFRRFANATKHDFNLFSGLKGSADILTEYKEYMKRICPSLTPIQTSIDDYESIDAGSHTLDTSNKFTPNSSRKSTPEKEKPSCNSKDTSLYSSDIENIITIPQSPVFLNAVIGRLFMDFLKSPFWTGEMTKLINKKLFYMRKPKLIEEIHVKELDMGNVMPVIQRASAPVLDSQGLWLDLDIVYEGNFCLSLESHINLFNLRKSNPQDNSGDQTKNSDGKSSKPSSSPKPASHSPGTAHKGNAGSPEKSTAENPPTKPMSHVFDPDADDSGESSEDDADIEFPPLNTPSMFENDPNNQQKPQNKFVKLAEGVARGMMKTDYVKKMVTNLGATPIVLKVELKKCVGTLAINIPPPPNDRIWLGFRTNPEMQLEARPQFGERHFNFTQITEWLRKKIILEFQRVAVCPNMTDVSVNLMEFSIPK